MMTDATIHRPDLRPLIAGRHIDSASAATLLSIDPSTEEVLWEVPVGDPVDVDRAVAEGRRAFDASDWRVDTDRRAESLLRLADRLDAAARELALLDTTEIGIPIGITSDDVGLATSIIRTTVELISSVGDDAEPPSRRVPRGVIAILAPWNFPFFVAVTKMLPALATGNCVVLKPTELATASAMRLGELADAAGLPRGVLSVLPGRGDVVGEALACHPGVDQVNLTGSTTTGRKVLATVAETSLVPVLTELGGKSAQLVGEHVSDLSTVADAIAQSIFWAAGQVCTAGSRLIVHERHHDELLAMLVERTSRWQPDDPRNPDVLAGPLGSEVSLSHVARCVAEAVDDGGKIVAGGSRVDRPGWFYPPTIVDGVTSKHRLFTTEVFGPVLAVTTYRSLDQGIALANATRFGLAATGWSDEAHESRAFADQLRAGWVTVNPHRLGPPNTRVGAESVGWSGSGVEGGIPGLRAATRLAVIQHGTNDACRATNDV